MQHPRRASTHKKLSRTHFALSFVAFELCVFSVAFSVFTLKQIRKFFNNFLNYKVIENALCTTVSSFPLGE